MTTIVNAPDGIRTGAQLGSGVATLALPLDNGVNDYYTTLAEVLVWLNTKYQKIPGATYNLSEFATIADAATTLNALGTCVELVLDIDVTLAASVSFDVEVIVRPVPGNVITLGAFDLTVRNLAPTGLFQWLNRDSTGNLAFPIGSRCEVYAEWWGADASDATDDTVAIQAAIDCLSATSSGTLKGASGIYRLRDVEWKSYVNIEGQGRTSTKYRFLPSGDDSVDASSYVFKSPATGAKYGKISHCTVDGNNGNAAYVGNGIELLSDGQLYSRTLDDVWVSHFAGYNASATGTYGMNECYTAAEMYNAGWQLTGGNCVKLSDTPGQTMFIRNCFFGFCDGTALTLGRTTDSKIVGTDIGRCGHLAIDGTNRPMNIQFDNMKIFRVGRLNVNENTNRMVPMTGVVADTNAAVILTGSRLNFTNLELQENGTNGLRLGYGSHELNHSYIQVLCDGNGGYDSDESEANNTSFRRYGIYASNYYNVKIDLIADDFETNTSEVLDVNQFTMGRQKQGIYIYDTPISYVDLTSMHAGQHYYIADVSGGADFTPLQPGVASPVNTVGSIFQARGPSASETLSPATVFGTGSLESVSSGLVLNAIIRNQTDQTDGSGVGYTISGDRQIESLITVNGIQLSSSVGRAKTITGDSDAVDVRGYNIVFCSTAGGNIVVGGLANGVTGQIVRFIKTSASNTLTLEHNEASGTQKIIASNAADIVLSSYGGVELVYSGSYWFDVNK